MHSSRKIPTLTTLAVAVLGALILFASLATAQSDPVKTMAKMVSEINHFPSADQQSTLADISEDESNSAATQAIAQAIHDMEHQAQPEDAEKLEQIAEDSSATEQERQLAKIVLDFNHKAGPEAQQQLQALTEQ